MTNEQLAALDGLVQFLNGSSTLEGVWFGDPHPTRNGAFWWRTILDERAGQLVVRTEPREDDVERVARAICESEGCNPSSKMANGEANWTTCIAQARAAIAAMVRA